MLTFKFKRRHAWFVSICDRRVELCAEEVENHITLPKGCTNIYLVFTTRKRADSFTLCKPGCANPLREVRTHIMYYTCVWFSERYRSGYRYVHVEYDDAP